jgi:hypothetical protein
MKRFFVFAAVLAALAAGGWRLAWGWAAGRVEEQIDKVMAAEAAKGRVWACAERKIHGFPGALELVCDKATLTTRLASGESAVWRLPRVVASAQATRPTDLRIEFSSPAELEQAGAVVATAKWAFLEIGTNGLPRPNRVNLLSDRFRLESKIAAPLEIESAKASMDLTATPAQPLPAGAARLGLAIGGLAFAPLEKAVGAGALNVELFGDLRQALALAAPASPAVRAEAWRQAGGGFDLKKLRAWSSAPNGPNVTGEGTLSLDQERRLAGAVTLSATGLDGLARAMGVNPNALAVGEALGGLFGGARKEAPAQPKALTLPLRFEDGAVWLGPIRTPARLAPLY